MEYGLWYETAKVPVAFLEDGEGVCETAATSAGTVSDSMATSGASEIMPKKRKRLEKNASMDMMREGTRNSVSRG